MPAVDIATVHNHGVQDVRAGSWSILAEIDTPLEFKIGIELDHVHLLQIEMKALQLQVQHRWKCEEPDALLGTLLPMALSFVCIVPLQRLLCCEVTEGLLDILELLAPLALDVELNVIKCLVTLGLVIHVDALDVVLHLSLKESFDGAIHGCALHLFLQPVAEDAVKLLCIMLSEGVHSVPTKRLHQLAAIHGLIRRLQLVEHVLQSLNQWRCLEVTVKIAGSTSFR
mmetsp:Transcript_139523/g.246599  ORF Transcript_139523/g.246599 Transcript_139523/m.246599 type:complete len:227 (-) Transcript_139523:313-993(-)